MHGKAQIFWSLVLASSALGGFGLTSCMSSLDAAGICGPGSTSDAGVPQCNGLLINGPCVTYASATGTAPMETGGTISPGTYFLSSVTYYGYAPGVSLIETLSMTNVTSASLTYDLAVVYSNQTIRSEGVGALSGDTITLTPSCPAGAAATTGQYTATEATFALAQGTNEVALFTKF
jgi:hypothetical protein